EDGALSRAAAVLGNVVVEGVLVSEADHPGALATAGPGGYGFEIGDHQIVAVQLEGLQVPQELPGLAVEHGGQGVDVAVPGDKGQAVADPVVAKLLHVEEFVRRASGEQVVHRHRPLAEFPGHGPGAGNVAIASTLHAVEYFHCSNQKPAISVSAVPMVAPARVSVGKCTPRVTRETPTMAPQAKAGAANWG